MEMTPALRRRLFPLYAGAFLQGFVLWYPIEKLFMQSIGFNDATIGLMIAVYSCVMLLTETPAGILADRWSRKGVLMLSSVVLALSALTGGLSHGVPMFMLSASLWGVFFAMYSGANDSIVYDVLEEEGHHLGLFDKAYGRVRTMDSMALVIGSLVGGYAAAEFGLRSSFFWTIIPALGSILVLSKLKEPKLHKASAPIAVREQIRRTVSAVVRNRALLPILWVLVLTTVLEFMMFEFDQLWLIALHTPTIWYGPANALLLSALGIGGVLAQFTRRNKLLFYTMSIFLMTGVLGLVFVHNLVGIIASQFVAILATITFEILYLRDLHDRLASQIRTGASSTVSSIGRAIIIPFALVFGYVSANMSIFAAAWMLVAVAVGTLAIVIPLRFQAQI